MGDTGMRFDRTTYFNYVRDVLFEGALEQVHVDGQNLILATFENQYGGTPMDDVRWLAYMLDVPPYLAPPDLADEATRNAMKAGENSFGLAAGSYGDDDSSRQLVVRARFSGGHTPPQHHVGSVVGFGAEKQVIEIAARGIVA